jgi:predicted NUDIX family NTP pyrophosphohydrolase
VWAVEAPRFEVDHVVGNQFELEWPPRSGRHRSFPEVDRAEWMSAAAAGAKLVKAQVAFVDRLTDHLRDAGTIPVEV